MRHAQPADAPLLADGFARLSSRSRQMRFLTGKRQLSGAGLRYFTDVDHHDHEALGALNQADGRGVGIARYIRHSSDPHAAEIPVTIVDDWHGRGLGTELLTRLSAGPAAPASAASLRWSRQTPWQWAGCWEKPGAILSAASRPPRSTRSR